MGRSGADPGKSEFYQKGWGGPRAYHYLDDWNLVNLLRNGPYGAYNGLLWWLMGDTKWTY